MRDASIGTHEADYPKDFSEQEANGGAKGSRTPDLLNAIQALSQLSYGPTLRFATGAVSGEEVFGIAPNSAGGF